MSHKAAMKKAPLMVGHTMGATAKGGTTHPAGKMHNGTGLTGAPNPYPGSVVPPTTVGGSAPGAGAMGARGYKNGGKVVNDMAVGNTRGGAMKFKNGGKVKC